MLINELQKLYRECRISLFNYVLKYYTLNDITDKRLLRDEIRIIGLKEYINKIIKLCEMYTDIYDSIDDI